MAEPEIVQQRPPLRYPMVLAALGVVFGDIGTSPLYSMHACLTPSDGVPVNPETVLGVLSLIFWALTLTISVKYMAIVLRADNKGEGGVLALMALVGIRAAVRGASAGRRTGRCRVRALLWRRGNHAGGHRARSDRGIEGRDAGV